MSGNALIRVQQNVARTLCYRIGSHSVRPDNSGDFRCICNGLTLWSGILLDHNLKLGFCTQQQRGFQGRVLSLPWLRGDNEVDLTSLLQLLDSFDDSLISEISSENRFKGDFLLRIKAPAYAGVLVDLCRSSVKALSEGRLGDGEVVTLLHQSFCFLKKMQLDRPDLVELSNEGFFDLEHRLAEQQEQGYSPDALKAIDEMNALARIHLHDFVLSPFRPKHGPGAVADTGVRCMYDKYLHFHSDARIEHLLDQDGLGTTKDYCPWLLPEKSTRTSRYVSVPKTWKKLRGISAEPVELQFFQHAVAARLDALFTSDLWWRNRINLHDQQKSRRLALLGSIHDGYATIDLSAASDSVTLELVKRVFKGTHVLLWLLGTRSTHTVCDEQTVRLNKFAPMGSACCFPVECMIFALAAQVASDRTSIRGLDSSPTVRVFGDDIIIDWYAADELIRILQELGFTVNTDKSYTSGGFREACGAEAYRGKEIQPLRFKRLDWSPEPEATTVGNIATALAYSNTLYAKGYHLTRAYLLSVLLNKQYRLKNCHRQVRRYLPATFDGLHGTLASPCPTNFNRLFRFDRRLFATEVKSIGFRLSPSSPFDDPAMAELFSWQKYHEWQLGHQPGLLDDDDRWSKGWIDLGHVSDLDERLPLGFIMTPTEKWCVWTFSNSLK